MVTRAGVVLASSLAGIFWLLGGATESGDGPQFSRSSSARPDSPLQSDVDLAPSVESRSDSRLALGISRESVDEPSACARLAAGSDWDDVAPQITAQMGLNRQTRDLLQSELMGGPIEVDLDWLEQRFGVAPLAPVLYELQVRAIELNLEIAVASGEYLDELDFQVNAALREGRFERRAGEIPAPAELEPLIFMQSTRLGDWATQLRLNRDEHPRLNYLQERVTSMVNARDLELARLTRRG